MWKSLGESLRYLLTQIIPDPQNDGAWIMLTSCEILCLLRVVWHHILAFRSQNHVDKSALTKYEQPLISVCIVTYNNPSTLKQAIMSIEEQDYGNYEIVLVDDGSTQADAQQYLQEVFAIVLPYRLD